MTKRHPLLTSAAGLSLLAVSAPALATDGEDGDHHAHVANWFDPMGEANHHAPALFWVMMTFAVFVFMLYRFAYPGLKQYLTT
jgi:hypothetical protein